LGYPQIIRIFVKWLGFSMASTSVFWVAVHRQLHMKHSMFFSEPRNSGMWTACFLHQKIGHGYWDIIGRSGCNLEDLFFWPRILVGVQWLKQDTLGKLMMSSAAVLISSIPTQNGIRHSTAAVGVRLSGFAWSLSLRVVLSGCLAVCTAREMFLPR
jgi:hypothetical protein